jgi:soluble lytic murein transglycosylase-like protein
VQRHPTQTRSGAEQSPGRAGIRSLLRRPAVQLLLCAVAGTQVVATRAAHPAAENEAVATLERVVVTPSAAGGVSGLWAERMVEKESQRLAAKYRAEGFRVPSDLARTISEAAVENGIDPEIAFGLVRAESSFRNAATSSVGAVGLTQLMPSTARWMEPGITRSQLRDPETNVRVGFKYLRYLIDKYDGNARLALIAYNRGPGTVDRALRRGRNPDNGYADFVFGKKDHGHKLFTD